MIADFPSESHRQELLGLVERSGFAALDGQQLLEFHAYRYAWRRVRLGNFEQKYGCDPKGQHFDGVLVNRAVDFYHGGRPPPPAAKRAPPSPDDIAHVERACAEFRYKGRAAPCSSQGRAFAPAPDTPAPAEAGDAALAAAQRELGLTASEA